ncbi:hypothetical protein CXF83_09910 [Shewanella sp. Choline-02u-19]|nr:hypothetical protein CXF84_00790 [Shewanella sp. Bg11-22]PKI27019.1 hypothetical protein CXF83_09910 [Shewanella sp. Choline-02u-19]
MSDKKSQFIREYQRQSKSPWNDHCTILLLADHQLSEGNDIKLTFARYIYQHRDSAGRILGMSISKSIQEEHPELDNQYLEDLDMYMVLLLLKDEVQSFCGLFDDEFESIFGLPPEVYFDIAEQHWAQKLEESL